MNRRPLVAGNWKLHKTVGEALDLVAALRAAVDGGANADVVVAPVATALQAVGKALEGSAIGLSGQNVYFENQGAFTGEVSAPLLRDVGCGYCIIGHSERRQLFGETDEAVARKTTALVEHDLIPIVCVGESLEEREAGKTLDVVLGQVGAALAPQSEKALSMLTIAYEPIWAIGTGRTAAASDAQEVHAAIRDFVAEKHGAKVADGLRILYGGSVKASNASELLSQADIDGALVGGASLEADAFIPIIQAAK